MNELESARKTINEMNKQIQKLEEQKQELMMGIMLK